MHSRLTAYLGTKEASDPEGFTLVEVLVAGVLMAGIMIGVSRLSTSALASSAKQAERQRIEASISNNIQMLQMEDSYLRFEDMSDEQQVRGCKNPTLELEAHLSEKVPAPDPPDVTSPIERTFETLNEPGLDLLIAKYKFLAPEHKGKSYASQRWEYRTVELNPNFSSRCYTTANS